MVIEFVSEELDNASANSLLWHYALGEYGSEQLDVLPWVNEGAQIFLYEEPFLQELNRLILNFLSNPG